MNRSNGKWICAGPTDVVIHSVCNEFGDDEKRGLRHAGLHNSDSGSMQVLDTVIKAWIDGMALHFSARLCSFPHDLRDTRLIVSPNIHS